MRSSDVPPTDSERLAPSTVAPIMSAAHWLAITAAAGLFVWLLIRSLGTHHLAPAAPHAVPALWAVAPFVGLLLSIAIFPLIPNIAHWWESNQHRLVVSLGFAAATVFYYLLTAGGEKVLDILDHALMQEYIPFIVLLFSLYVISGGICLKGDLAAHPITNTAFLAVGATIASVIGTTGASMLLIRPLLQTNSERTHVRHTVIFFIFLVSNVGGCLLPTGDPPLFLGYLRGVPFLWTLTLWKEWAFACSILLAIYFVWDWIAHKCETPRDVDRDETQRTPLTLKGTRNLGWLLAIVLTAALIKPGEPVPLLGFRAFPYFRELLMLLVTAVSVKTTSRNIHEDNRFSYHAILEVAALFVGIFICMQAPIEILKTSGATLQPFLSSPDRFFWATGILSSALDNAPTYVVFLQTAAAMTPADAVHTVTLSDGSRVLIESLTAISLGSVFMGANTYIGNGPNFMVRSIAEQSGVKMPSFFGYMLYSGAILIPVFILISILFV